LEDIEMKAKYILLCSAVLFFAAAPLWADRMDSGRAGVDDRDFLVSVGDHSNLERLASQGNSFDISTFQASDSAALLSLPAGSVDFADFSASRADGAWWKEIQGRNDGRNWEDRPPVSTPEPGSLSLLLVGLFGLGSLAWRHGPTRSNPTA
jgi:hypothetical protein